MFINVYVVNPKHLALEDELGWWRKDEVQHRTYAAQAQVLARPERTAAFTLSKDGGHLGGAWATLDALAACEGNLWQQIQLLKAGALHPLIDSSRRQYSPMYLPPMARLREIQAQVHEAAGLSLAPWSHNHTDVLPFVSDERGRVLNAFNGGGDYREPAVFLMELDRQVGLLLEHWQPVRIRYAADVATAERILAEFNTSAEKLAADRKAEAQAAQHAQWKAEHARRDQAEAARCAALRQQHPRYDDWPPTPTELRQLVWAQPVSTLAKLFGVSDTAIRKLCDRERIARPPQGYWLRKSAVSVHAPA